MLKRVSRLFVIKTRFEALVVIHALALGAVERGIHYLREYPGMFGWLLFVACFGAVFMAGAKLLDAVALPQPRPAGERRNGDRRQPPARPA